MALSTTPSRPIVRRKLEGSQEGELLGYCCLVHATMTQCLADFSHELGNELDRSSGQRGSGLRACKYKQRDLLDLFRHQDAGEQLRDMFFASLKLLAVSLLSNLPCVSIQ